MLVAALCVAPPGIAHFFPNWLPLEPVGYLDPFGHDSLHRYTDVASRGGDTWLATRDRGAILLRLDPDGKPVSHATYATSPQPAFTSVAMGPRFVYLATEDDGVHVVSGKTVPSPLQVARIDDSNGAFDRPSFLLLYRDRLFITGRKSPRIAVFDVRQPRQPVLVNRLETGETGELRDLSVAGSHLYAAGTRGRDGEGAVYVYDLANLDGPARVIATGEDTASVGVTPDERFLVASHVRLGGTVTIHDLLADDPASPLERIDAADYEINSFSPSRVSVKNQVAYIAWHQGGVQVIDLDTLDTDGRSQRVGAFGTATGISPLAGAAGNVRAYPYLSDDRILLVDSRWGLYVVDARRVLPPASEEMPP